MITVLTYYSDIIEGDSDVIMGDSDVIEGLLARCYRL